MKTDYTLADYQEQEPRNRKERRQLLKTQGWYFEVKYPYSNAWVCYKVAANGYKEEFDKSDNHNTKG